jgi:hypothetical protein
VGPQLSRPVGFAVGWLVATCVAVVIGLAVVTTLGGSLHGRGPLGDGSAAEQPPAGPPAASDLASASPGERRTFDGGYGRLAVGCQGPYATILERQAAPGWRVLSVELGPDDDVEAVFGTSRRTVELEVFCDAGRPALAELERNEVPAR